MAAHNKESPDRLAAGTSSIARMEFRSVSADVDGAQATAERRQRRPRHVAAVVATDVADAEAVAPVVIIAAETAAPSKRLGGCGRGEKRKDAQGSCCNKCKSKFT